MSLRVSLLFWFWKKLHMRMNRLAHSFSFMVPTSPTTPHLNILLRLMDKGSDNVILISLKSDSYVHITIMHTMVLPEDAITFPTHSWFQESVHQNRLRIYLLEFTMINEVCVPKNKAHSGPAVMSFFNYGFKTSISLNYCC